MAKPRSSRKEMVDSVRVADLTLVLMRYGIRAPHEVPSFMRGVPQMLEAAAGWTESGTPPVWFDEFLEKALADGSLRSKDYAEAVETLRRAAARIRAVQQH